MERRILRSGRHCCTQSLERRRSPARLGQCLRVANLHLRRQRRPLRRQLLKQLQRLRRLPRARVSQRQIHLDLSIRGPQRKPALQLRRRFLRSPQIQQHRTQRRMPLWNLRFQPDDLRKGTPSLLEIARIRCRIARTKGSIGLLRGCAALPEPVRKQPRQAMRKGSSRASSQVQSWT